jgi:FAD/FMN-containing dehydrogenase
VLRPRDAGYDAARTVHNAMIDRRPGLIVRCAGAADVVAAVRFAGEHGLLLSVRGGGHSIAGLAVGDGGLMLDLSRMRGVRVDPEGRTARVEGGATWGDVDHETQLFGLATTGGVVRPTGVAGLTLGGGHGFLMRAHGLACDNLLSVDVVTAAGAVLTASAEAHPDFFWGLRGGGGNFGVATSFEFRLHPVDTVLGGLVLYPMTVAREFLRRYRDGAAAAPDTVGANLALATLPDGTPVAVLLVGCHGPLEEGERFLAPFRHFGPPLADQVAPMPYAALQRIAETFNPPGRRNYWKSDYLQELSDAAIDALVEGFAAVPAPLSHVVIEHLGGAVARVAPQETAVSYREARFNAAIIGMWDDPAADAANIAWVRAQAAALRPFATGGVYVNYLGDEGPDRVRAAYGHEKYTRLQALKARYDPTNLFRLNQNIIPAP